MRSAAKKSAVALELEEEGAAAQLVSSQRLQSYKIGSKATIEHV